MAESKCICCFCGKRVPVDQLMILKVINPDEDCVVKEQLFYSHASCIRANFGSNVVMPVLRGRE